MYSLSTQRVVALVDMDCFYCQVETRLNPSLKGKPVAVVQYNQWKGGGIIAVNYEAREQGVTRHMRGAEAQKKCPDLVLVPVPTIRGKADLSNYRDAGDEVAKVFSEFCDCVQRASIDEAYLDLTKAVDKCIEENIELKAEELTNTYVLGYCDLKNKSEESRNKGLLEWLKLLNDQKMIDLNNYKLAIGGVIVEKMRSEIKKKTGFHCSAGIAHNKILAKLTAGLHKPNKQTILPQDSIPELFESLPIHKVRNLGGKLGKLVSEKLSINFMSELYKFSLEELKKKFDEKTGIWLYNIARGIDLDPVTSRLKPESIGCCKNFTGKAKLTTKSEVRHWLTELAAEISERLYKDLERNKRRAKLLTVSFFQETPMSRCGALNSYSTERIVKDALDMLKKFNTASPEEDIWNPPIKYLGLSASKFTGEISSIDKYFINGKNTDSLKNTEPTTTVSIYDSKTINKFEEKDLLNDNLNATDKVEPETSNETPSKSKQNLSVIDKVEPGTSNETPSKSKQNLNATDIVEPGTSNETPSKSKQNLNATDKVEPGTSNGTSSKSKQSPSSFFIDFMNKKRNENEVKEKIKKLKKEEESGRKYENLIFSDSNELQAVVTNIKNEEKITLFTNKEIKEGEHEQGIGNPLSFIKDEETKNSEEKEICSKCGKYVLLAEFPEHVDYHAALELHAEINKTTSNGEIGVVKNKRKNLQNDSKRKKREVVTLTKKMKSIQSFFSSVPKQ